MPVQRNSLPDPARSGVGVVTSATWDAGTPERRCAAVEAIGKVWESRDWPHEGLISYSVHTCEDGRTLLHYAQWADEAAYLAFRREGQGERDAEIDAVVPGIERSAPRSYELLRSTPLGEGGDRVPGAVVIVDVELDGPDPQRQRDWMNTVLEALRTEPNPHPGGISAHFHASTDGVRVMNYAEWESVEAHVEAVSGPGQGVGSPTPQWQRVLDYPGVAGRGVRRYTPALSFGAGV